MAKVTCRYECSKGREGYRIRFYDPNGKRRAIWLGNESEAVGLKWRGHVEHLLFCLKEGEPQCAATSQWLKALSKSQRQKLEAVELIEAAIDEPAKPATDPSVPIKLEEFVNWYISRRTVKEATSEKWCQVRDALVRHFGADKLVASITPADAEAWRDWLAREGNVREGKQRTDKKGKKVRGRTTLADNTVRRRTGIAKQFFGYAVKAKLTTVNPFTGLAASVHGNEARQYFVTYEQFDAAIAATKDPEWQAIIALSRLGGLRCPSEVMRLTWDDVNLKTGRMVIHATKTEHHRDGGIRPCPIFPELRPFLERLADQAKKPTSTETRKRYVIQRRRGSESYLRTGFLRVLKTAKIEPWPKLFHNMRASRQTELLDQFGIKDVCAWLGNSEPIAMKHYAMQRSDSFARAAGLAHDSCGPVGGPENGKTGQNQAETGEAEESEKPQKPEGIVLFPADSIIALVGEEGLEPPTSTL